MRRGGVDVLVTAEGGMHVFGPDDADADADAPEGETVVGLLRETPTVGLASAEQEPDQA